jgi:hypothetical protein
VRGRATLARHVEALLFGVKPHDPSRMALSIGALSLMTLLAA